MPFDNIKKSSMRVKMRLRSVYKVTEFRKGCVYKTKQLGMIVCMPDYEFLPGNEAYLNSVSTDITREIMK